MGMITYQDLTKAKDNQQLRTELVRVAIEQHKASKDYQIAVEADEYDHQRNTTINNFVKTIMAASGQKIIDFTAANNKIASNFFHRLNTQRNMYSLGNGVMFSDDKIKEKLGAKADSIIQRAGYYALIHKVSFLFWNYDHLHCFKLTEFVPLWDELTSELGAGVRFYQTGSDKPMTAVLYEADGYTKYMSNGSDSKLTMVEEKKPYIQTVKVSQVSGAEVIGEQNYSSLPIVPLWGNKLHQSTLVGMQQSIDSYDIIASGFANDLTDCAQIYWIIENACGMDQKELGKFRENLLLRHIATTDADSGVSIKPYTQEIPWQSRCEYLDRIRQQIYENFGAFDCSSVSAAAKTATEINAAYQALDEEADDFEYQIIEAVEKVLALQGITGDAAVPLFRRNRIANQLEQTQMVMMASNALDEEAVLNLLPFLTPEMVKDILERKAQTEIDRINIDEE